VTGTEAVAGKVLDWGLDNERQLAHYPLDSTMPSDRQVPQRYAADGTGHRLPVVSAIDAGDDSSLAVLPDGKVLGWGANEYGELGLGLVSRYESPTVVPGLTDAVRVAAGTHSLALRADGTIAGWGDNYYGQVGDGTGGSANRCRTTPVQVAGLTDVIAVDSNGRWSFSVALRADGTVWTWGANHAGQLGQGTVGGLWLRPAKVAGVSDVTAVSAGDGFVLALRSDGTVVAWGGFNEYGQLGNGTISRIPHPEPARVLGLTDAVAVAAGAGHAVALTADGSARSWGNNHEGQLGINDLSCPASPVPVRNAASDDDWDPELRATKIEAGANVTLAIRRDGTLVGWGACRGQLLPTGNRTPPIVVPRPRLTVYRSRTTEAPSILDGIAAVSIGRGHVLTVQTGRPEHCDPGHVGDVNL